MLPVDYLLFLQIVFFLCITPGTPRVVITTYAINYGLRRSAITAFGDISANTIQMIFVAFGIGTIIAANPEILNYAKWVGVIYLLYLAFDLKRSSKNFGFEKNLSSKSNFSLYRDGFAVAFFSPKAWVFFGAMFPQFLNLNGDFKIQLLILIFSYVLIDFSTLILYGFAAKKIVTWLKVNPKTINTISACALLIIAIIFAFSSFGL
jgi:threonine/homoserine/homoserine lactone efflux protein